MRHGRIIWLLMVFLLGSYSLEGKGINVYSEQIASLVLREDALEKQILESSIYKVSIKQWAIIGGNEKYVLKGLADNLYLFKRYTGYQQKGIFNSVWAVRLSALCGVPDAQCYDLWLPVNGKLVYGTIQQVIKGERVNNYSDLFQDNNWLAYYLFRWLLNDVEPQFLLTAEGKLISIDMDKIGDEEDVDINLYDVGRFAEIVRISLRQDNFNVFYRKAISFIDYVQALPEQAIIAVSGSFAYKEKMEGLIKRKHKLKDEFQKLVLQTAKEEKIILRSDELPEDVEAYPRNLLAELKKRVAVKELILKRIKEKPRRQANLDIITAPKGFADLDFSTLPISKLLCLAQQRIAELKNLRENTKNPYTLLALSLYINQYEQLLPWYAYGVLPLEEIRFIIAPEAVDPKAIEANLYLGYSRDCKSRVSRGISRFQQYSLDGLKDMVAELTNKKGDGWDYLMAGNCFWANLDLGRALIEYKKVTALPGADKETLYLAYLLRGCIYELNNEWLRFGAGCNLAKAEEEFKQAIKVKPRSILAHLNLLVIYLQRSEFKPAQREIAELAVLDLAWNSKEKEIKKLAVGDMEGLRFALLDEEGHYVMALVYLIKGEPELMKKHLEKTGKFDYLQK